MQKKVVTSLIILLITILIVIKGNSLFNVFAFVIGLIGLKEFLDATAHKSNIPLFIRFMAYVFMSLVILVGVKLDSTMFYLDYRMLSALFLSFLIPIVLYHDKEKYSVKDAFYVIGGILFLGISCSLLIVLRNISLKTVMFVLTIAISSDIFTYLTGYYIGKHKLLPNIFPKKTWEGLFGGVIMGCFISVMFYNTCINPSFNLFELTIICLFLSLMAQVGDMVFSALKKQFGISEFSKLFVSIGGILDRLDSIIFVVLSFSFFIGIL